MILGKSQDPVLVKKLEFNIWSLKDEIESALGRLHESTSDKEILIKNLNEFYSPRVLNEPAPITDSSGNPLDEEALEMMRAMGEDLPSAPEAKPENPFLKEYKREKPSDTKITTSFSMISEINMDEVLLFSQKKFIHGQIIVLEPVLPHPFMLTAEVINCIDIGRKSRIISDSKPNYRMQVKLLYQFPEEKDRLRNFLLSIAPDLNNE